MLLARSLSLSLPFTYSCLFSHKWVCPLKEKVCEYWMCQYEQRENNTVFTVSFLSPHLERFMDRLLNSILSFFLFIYFQPTDKRIFSQFSSRSGNMWKLFACSMGERFWKLLRSCFGFYLAFFWLEEKVWLWNISRQSSACPHGHKFTFHEWKRGTKTVNKEKERLEFEWEKWIELTPWQLVFEYYF